MVPGRQLHGGMGETGQDVISKSGVDAWDKDPALTVNKALKPLRFSSLFSSVPVVVWLFTQLVMTGGWSVGASAIGTDEYAGQAIVIGTDDGLATIYLDEDGNPIKDEDGKMLTMPCDWCVSFSVAPTLTAVTELLDFVPSDSGYKPLCRVSDDRRPQATDTNVRIRAPPVRAMS